MARSAAATPPGAVERPTAERAAIPTVATGKTAPTAGTVQSKSVATTERTASRRSTRAESLKAGQTLDKPGQLLEIEFPVAVTVKPCEQHAGAGPASKSFTAIVEALSAATPSCKRAIRPHILAGFTVAAETSPCSLAAVPRAGTSRIERLIALVFIFSFTKTFAAIVVNVPPHTRSVLVAAVAVGLLR